MNIGASQPVTGPSVAPIPPMPEHYVDSDARREWLRNIFDETAKDYDRVEAVMSLGTGRGYRRDALVRAGLSPGMCVLDVAMGTGLVAREAMRIVGSGGRVVGLDPSSGMLERARAGLGVEAIVGVAESLPFPDATFDFISMGYALRHISDLSHAFAEFARVLKPQGRACILEMTRPNSVVGRTLMRAHIGAANVVARCVSSAATRTPELWRYYWKTIDQCVTPRCVVEAMRIAGFEDASCRRTLGIFSEFVGSRS